MDEKKSSWWTTLPGILTGIAGLITATGGLLLILHTIGVIGTKQKERTGEKEQKPNVVSEEMEQHRKELEATLERFNHLIDSLQSEIDSMRPEEKENPDARLGIEDRLNKIRTIERDKLVLENELRNMKPRE